jgi:hypothetical protein
MTQSPVKQLIKLYGSSNAIMNHITGKRVSRYSLESEPSEKSLAIVTNVKTHKYKFICSDPRSKDDLIEKDGSPNITLHPWIPIDERFVLVVSGKSGSGKSVVTTPMIFQYAITHPNNKIYYVSMNNLARDPSLSKIESLIHVQPSEFEYEKVEDYINSLIIVDDCDEESAKLFKTVDRIAHLGRKYDTSLIFITHYNSKLNKSNVYRECNFYVCYPSNIRNNRLLKNNEVSQSFVEDLFEQNCTFYCFNFMFDAVITNLFVRAIEYGER